MSILLVTFDEPLQFSVTPVGEGAIPPIAAAAVEVPASVPIGALAVLISVVSTQDTPFQSSVAPVNGGAVPP